MNSTNLDRLPQVLFEIGKAIGSDKGLNFLFESISASVCDLFSADACSVMLLDSSRTVLLGRAAHGLDAGRIEQISFRVGEGVAGWVAQTGEPTVIVDCAVDARFVRFPSASPTPYSSPQSSQESSSDEQLEPAASRIRSMACVPLIARGETVGVLTVTDSAPNNFGDSDQVLLSFIAKTIALDMENVRLRKVSVTDALTRVYNREFLQRRLPAEIERARQRGQSLSVAMIDIDHFKAVNDRFGHDTGDLVLAEVANRLAAAIRKDDSLVRYGGEEFLVLLPETDADRAHEVGERMRQSLQDVAVDVEADDTIDVRISVGVAELNTEDDSKTLVKRADAALYRAKEFGRNRVEVAAISTP